MRQRATRRWRLIFHLFLVSLVLNGALLSTLLYLIYRPIAQEKPEQLYLSNGERLAQLKTLAFAPLLGKLLSIDPVENGFKERDLALAILVSDRDFDIDRACPGCSLQRRQVLFKQAGLGSMTLFCGLGDREYASILAFAEREQWPLTAEGLFKRLKEQNPNFVPSLLQTFLLSAPFLEVEQRFHRGGVRLSRQNIVTLLMEGEWSLLQECLQEAAKGDSPQELLLAYAKAGSPQGCALLLEVYAPLLLKHLSDDDLLLLIPQLSADSITAAAFARALLLTPRSDVIWKSAAALLAKREGVSLSEPYDHSAVLAQFVKTASIPVRPAVTLTAPQQVSTQVLTPVPVKKLPSPTTPSKPTPHSKPSTIKPPAVEKKKEKTLRYIVQKGDTLWRVSQLFNTSEERLRKLNALKSDHLTPGSILLVPSFS